MQTTFVVLHSFSFARSLAFHRLSFTHITFTRFLSLSHSPSVFCVCVPPVCVRVYLSLSAHDDISCLHVLLLMMQGTLHNTSKAVHGCFTILLDNALYDAYLIHAYCNAHPLSVSTRLYTFLSIIAAMTLSHCIVT